MEGLDEFISQPIQVQILQILRNIVFKDHYNMIERHQLVHGCIKEKICVQKLNMQKKMHKVLDEYDAKIKEITQKEHEKELPK